ncbi:uncharacterized protein LOC123555254 [Mercenaria mercenaria]|uniref:uncharacterized protein LOC123555254 n=1 Tax=Mercenaria mercenaria TaxID=6596 RepID=UPI00234EA108|nr:uncharacterized protein LOC123555254 [Mercenaria mercenaria]
MALRFPFLLCLVVSTEFVVIKTQEATGPICYSCVRTDNPEDCRQSVTCTSNQVCSVQEVIAPHGDFYFWSGCEDIGVCEDLSYTGTLNQIIGRRQTSSQESRCSYCCDGDMCNRNCTSFVNLALHKPAYQSSVDYNGPANLAVDGNKTKNYYKGSCTHTKMNIIRGGQWIFKMTIGLLKSNCMKEMMLAVMVVHFTSKFWSAQSTPQS